MNTNQSIEPSVETTGKPAGLDLAGWRDRLLSGMLYAAAALGLPAAVGGSLTAARDQQPARIAVFAAAYALILIMALGRRRIPFRARAYTLLAMAFLLGVDSLRSTALPGSGRIFLFAFAVIATLLLGMRAGIIALVLSVLTTIGAAAAFSTGLIPFSPQVMASTDLASWITGGAVFALLALMAVIALGMLQSGLETAFSAQRQLLQRLSGEHGRLASDIEARNAVLEQRARHLQTAAEIARLAAQVNEPQDLLNQVVELIRMRFDYYHVSFFRLDESGTWAILTASTGEAGRNLLARGHRLAVGSASIVGWVTDRRQPRIASSVEQDPFHFRNPALPDTRAEMAVPVMAGERLIGALDVQSTQVEAFDEAEIQALQAIASELAVSLENAELLDKTRRQLERIEQAQQGQTRESWGRLERSARSPIIRLTSDGTASPADSADFPTAELATQSGRKALAQDGREVAVPIMVRGEVIASISARRQAVDEPWNEVDIALLEAVAGQAGLAIENARQYYEEQRRTAELEVINRVSQAVSQLLRLDSLYRVIHAQIAQILGDVNLSIAVYHPDGDLISYPYISDQGEVSTRGAEPLGGSLPSLVVHSRQPLLLARDVDQRARELGATLQDASLQSWLGVPMLIGNDIIGVLMALDSEQPGRFTEDDAALLSTIASQVATAIQNARLLEQSQRAARRERLIHEITSKVRQSQDIKTILETTARELGRALNAEGAAVQLEPIQNNQPSPPAPPDSTKEEA
jgi:GAF domain-containing protein